MLKAIEDRKSIRKFSGQDIPDKVIREIIESGIKAPSAKNRQPWKFIVVKGDSKASMLEAFKQGLRREEHSDALLPESSCHLGDAKRSIEIMEQAPVVVFIVNIQGKGLLEKITPEERIYETANIESIGAAIQNMLLEATERDIGSLWICNVFFAYQELRQWLNTEGDMAAAVAFGYTMEQPEARPRKKFDDTVVWRI
jgi:nitroreductase